VDSEIATGHPATTRESAELTEQTDLLRMNVFVLLNRALDVSAWRENFESGDLPDGTPYGFHLAQSDTCKVSFSRPTKSTLAARSFKFVLGFDLFHALNNWRSIQSSDVVWTMSEREYLAALFLMALAPKKKSPKVLAQTIWLFDRWEKLSTVRKAFYRWLIARAAVLTVHSKSYLGLVQSMFSEADVRLTYFAISADSFPLAQPIAENRTGKLRIFSAGNDQSRDWGTLFEALGGDERFEVVVAIRGIEAKQVRRFSNFTVLDPANIAGFRASYSWADFTVIPMKPNRYSGITVALEATASGSTLICSDTGGVPTYFSHDEAIFVPPGDPVALRNAALAVGAEERAIASRAQRRFIERDYTTKGLARRHIELSRELLGVELVQVPHASIAHCDV